MLWLTLKPNDSYGFILSLKNSALRVRESFPHLLTEFCTKLSTENVNKIALLFVFLFITLPNWASYPSLASSPRLKPVVYRL
ncbi:MAG TPA: hypothetical protein DD850_10410 [Erwinia persicina]|nr:hypothetical protein [Erwinia persicina]HBI07115.1 hypothetical protein [Erwinia persicina]HBQ79685.1 hypothetical protein [Erwinia persicina]HBT14516.1 hypothetical protein [Erwinia persicina]HBT30276.1 hypothetical protein [Erwinia persicina]